MPNPEIDNPTVVADAMPGPLICALNGALLKTDLAAERTLHKVKNALDTLMSSRKDLQRIELERADTTVSDFEVPVNEEVLNFLSQEKSKGRHIVLDTTETAESLSEILADKSLFDEITDLTNTTLPEKFDYIGGKRTSKKLWEQATDKFLVGPSTETPQGFSGHFTSTSFSFKKLIKAIRAYQWLKNLLVFVPVITSQQLSNPNALKSALIMFCCFSAVASLGYIFNDLLDLQSDRAHPTKRNRPFASGALSAQHGMLIGGCLLLIAVVGCFFLPTPAAWALAGYLALTLGYSTYLKTKLMLDVVCLGGLFTLRVIGGAAAIQSDLSFYLLIFSIFLFSSLGMVKRFAELHNLQIANKLSARGRGYRVEDMAPVRMIGISLGYMSVFIMGLYINSPLITEYYSNPKVIWFLIPLLTYWLGRLWIIANRGEVHEDPLIFALKDSTSLLVAAISAVILVIAN